MTQLAIFGAETPGTPATLRDQRTTNMERLQTKRLVTRTEIERLSEEIKAAVSIEDFQPHHEERLAEITDELDALARELKEQDELIEVHVKDENLAEEYRTVRETQSVITRMRTRIRRLESKTTSSIESGIAESAEGSNTPTQSRAGQLKLPKLELQRYDGEKLNWLPFWEQFRQAIHDNIKLSGVEKFLYLRTVLTGKAAAAISGIQATEHSYAYAVELLKERFGKKDVLVQEHLTQLLNLPKVKALSDVGALRRLHDHVNRNIASLRTLGIDSDSYGAMLCAALFCVLPADWAVDFYKSQSASNEAPESATLEAVLRSIRIELDSRERVYDGSTRDQPQPLKIHSDRDRSSDNPRGKGSAASLAVGAKPSNDRCPLCCSELHEAPQCNSEIPIEEKKRRLRSEGRCYRCAKRGHTSRECRNRFLHCAKCGRRHITPLCDPSPPSIHEATATELHSLASLNVINKNAVMLQTAQVWVDGRDRKRLARCLFDGGSQRSFVTERLSRELRLEVIGEEEVIIYSFGGTVGGTTRKRRLVRLWLRSQYSRKEHCLEALEIENICSDQLVLPDNVVDLAGVGELELADVTLSPFLNSARSIEILVGADHYWNMVSGEVRKIQGSLVALKTDFGWTLQGPVPQVASVLSCSTVAVLEIGVAKPTLSLSNELRAFWELESLGISVNDSPRGKEEEQVREDFTSSLALVMGRYEAKLPWKPINRLLENNEDVALQRLDKLVRRLRGNAERLTQYDSAIRSYLKEGFAEKVPEGEIDTTSKRVYYLPHRAVFRPDSSTTKIRIVFDASAKAPGCLSLNDALSTGPNLNPDLLQLIINFRRHAIAFTADIEKAFLQILIKQEDRDALRFLWYARSPTEEPTSAETEAWRMTRVPFGATSSPFMLAATIKHHLSNVSEDLSETARVLDDCLYVDDLIAGTATLETATNFYIETQQILSSAGMKMRKWSSNSELLQQRFDEDGVGNLSCDTSTPRSGVTRVLGLKWNREKDELKYSLESTLELLTINRDTKRFVLQASARIFDPLGLLSPVTITAKMLFQELWALGLDWDTPLPPSVSLRWSDWIKALHHLEDISIPRRYAAYSGRTELHVFTDASPQAYGTVAYLRSDSDDQMTVTLVMAKTRVAPVKTLTLPRLELMGALLGARLCDYIKGVFKSDLSEVTLWTDSMIALHWIKGLTTQWKPFVANRVMEIQQRTEPSNWRHCPGAENPADLLTRGVPPDCLQKCGLWWKGPKWLAESPTCWPTTPTGTPGTGEIGRAHV